MGHWHFKSYEGQDGNQPWEWLDQQGENVREYVYSQLYGVSNTENAPIEHFADLPGRYVGLSHLSIHFESPFGIRHVALIGFWQPDSTNFIVVLCSEVDDNNYGLLLEKALGHKHDWEEKLGEVYDLFPGEYSI